MIKKLLPLVSSIKIKLFLWFWVITLCSFGAARIVMVQLSDNVVTLPAHGHDVEKLTQLSRFIARTPKANTEQATKQLKRMRMLKYNRKKIWLKLTESHQVIQVNGRPHPELNEFLTTTELSELNTWQFPKYRLTGPIKVQINGEAADLFLSERTKVPKHISIAFLHLPLWAKLIVPMLVSFILCWLLARSLSKPISDISKTALKFGEGELNLRLDKQAKRGDELGHLAQSFNHMADKLEQSMSAQQRLIGDVSHELRSPLTRMQMALALAQSNFDKPDNLKKNIERCELEVSRLDGMIGDVLALSRLESALLEPRLEPCSLPELIKILVDDANFVATEKNVTVAFNHEQEPTIKADSQLLASALGNIINNAVKYSPENANVIVNLSKQATGWKITVQDQGHGVPQEALTQLFEPFYRVADARDRSTGGTGLGLAIAKQAIKAHNGNIFAENANNQGDSGLIVTVELPE